MSNEGEEKGLREPEIGEYVRGVGTLVEILPVDPPPKPPPTVDYVFEAITARCELRLGTEVVKTFCHVNDAYGKETSVVDAVERAKRYAAKHRLGPESPLEVVAIRIAERTRKKEKGRENFYDRRFKWYESEIYGCKYGMPEPVETIVWSSKNDN